MDGNQVTGVAARAEPERDVMCGLEVVLADGARSLGAALGDPDKMEELAADVGAP
jgi:hypothetical protein